MLKRLLVCVCSVIGVNQPTNPAPSPLLAADLPQPEDALTALPKDQGPELTWSQQWRRINKKTKVDAVQKKKRAKSGKVYKAIQGITIEDIRKRRNLAPEAKKAKRDASLREIKERKKAGKADAKKKAASFAKGAKAVKGGNKAGKGGRK